MSRGLIRPRLEPERPCTRHSDGSRSGLRAGRRGASGGRSAGSNRVRSTGCASSRGSLPRRPQRTRRRRRTKRVMGAGSPERWIPPPPSPRAAQAAEEQVLAAGAETPSCRAVSRRGRACRESTGACHKGVWECRRGGWERRSRRRSSTHRILKKEEAGLLHLEVSGRSSRRSGFVRLKPIFFVFRVRTVAPTIPPHARKGA
jgi:hypothetical protein